MMEDACRDDDDHGSVGRSKGSSGFHTLHFHSDRLLIFEYASSSAYFLTVCLIQ
jgi:hypothetical protein